MLVSGFEVVMMQVELLWHGQVCLPHVPSSESPSQGIALQSGVLSWVASCARCQNAPGLAGEPQASPEGGAADQVSDLRSLPQCAVVILPRHQTPSSALGATICLEPRALCSLVTERGGSQTRG